MDDENITSLLDELSSFDFSSTSNKLNKNQELEQPITDDTTNQYFLDKYGGRIVFFHMPSHCRAYPCNAQTLQGYQIAKNLWGKMP